MSEKAIESLVRLRVDIAVVEPRRSAGKRRVRPQALIKELRRAARPRSTPPTPTRRGNDILDGREPMPGTTEVRAAT